MTYRDMSDVTRIQYLRSEIVVSPIIYDAACQILSAFINTKQANDKNINEMMEKSVKYALELALTTDRLVSSTANVGGGGKL